MGSEDGKHLSRADNKQWLIGASWWSSVLPLGKTWKTFSVSKFSPFINRFLGSLSIKMKHQPTNWLRIRCLISREHTFPPIIMEVENGSLED